MKKTQLRKGGAQESKMCRSQKGAQESMRSGLVSVSVVRMWHDGLWKNAMRQRAQHTKHEEGARKTDTKEIGKREESVHVRDI